MEADRLISIITAGLALAVVYANARFGIRNKQADLTIHFHKQFDELQKKRAELLVAVAEKKAGVATAWSDERLLIESHVFFDRFWSLQFDQFLAWYEGYVPTRLYIYWVYSRWRELRSPSTDWTFDGKTLVSTLNELRDRWQYSADQSTRLSVHVTKFLTLLTSLKVSSSAADVDALVRRHGPAPYMRLVRRLFGAY